MSRLRKIKTAYQYIKELDPETELSVTSFRALVVNGRIPSVRIGEGCRAQYLVDLDTLDKCIAKPENAVKSRITAIPERIERKGNCGY